MCRVRVRVRVLAGPRNLELRRIWWHRLQPDASALCASRCGRATGGTAARVAERSVDAG